jgi:hypothetical protein
MLGVMYFSEKRAKLGTAGQIKLMQNVGQNIEWTNRLSEYLRGKGIKVIEQAPRPKRTKWEIGFWCKVFNWEGRVAGEHARDAACIGYFSGI